MTDDSPSYLKVSNLSKDYGDGRGIHNINFSMKRGQWGGIIGPSGSGKSTLLKVIAGIERENSGKIYLSGKSLHGTPITQRKTLMVWQELNLFPSLTVEENIRFGIQSQDTDLSSTLRMFCLHEDHGLLGRRVNEISGGQKQRVALARSVAPEPPLLLLDEPFGQQDANTRDDMLAQLTKLKKSNSLTALIVSHNQSEIFAICDWVIVLKDGRTAGYGTPEDLISSPKDGVVAALVGENNVFHGKRRQDGQCSITIGETTVTWKPVTDIDSLSLSDDICAVVPSAKIFVAAKASKYAHKVPFKEVLWASPGPSRACLHFDVGDKKVVKVTCEPEEFYKWKNSKIQDQHLYLDIRHIRLVPPKLEPRK